MNILKLSTKYLLHTSYRTAISVILMAIGIATAVSILIVSSQFEERMKRSIAGVDLIIGAKGDPAQIFSSTVLNTVIPSGNFDINELAAIIDQNSKGLLSDVIPIILGDNYEGFRIVGTNINYLIRFGSYSVETAHFPDKLNTALIGFNVAKRTGLKVGDSFISSHGLSKSKEEHAEFPYRVIGIMNKKNTAIDDVILVTIDSVHNIHKEMYGKITAAMLIYLVPKASSIIEPQFNKNPNFQIVYPDNEAKHLLNIIGKWKYAIIGVSFLFIGLAFANIFLSFCFLLKERRYDLALMLALGSSRLKVAALPFIESGIICFLGCAAGLILAHVAVHIIGIWTEYNYNLSFSGFVFVWAEFYIVLITFVIGLMTALIPAIKAFSLNILKIMKY